MGWRVVFKYNAPWLILNFIYNDSNAEWFWLLLITIADDCFPSQPILALRIYPVPFAREVCDLMELMKKTRLGQPELPAVLPDALETFGNLQVADPLVWRKVNLPSVYNYLRRNKKLNIPVEWQHVMPKKIGWVLWVSLTEIIQKFQMQIRKIQKFEIRIRNDSEIYDFLRFWSKKKGLIRNPYSTRTQPIIYP